VCPLVRLVELTSGIPLACGLRLARRFHLTMRLARGADSGFPDQDAAAALGPSESRSAFTHTLWSKPEVYDCLGEPGPFVAECWAHEMSRPATGLWGRGVLWTGNWRPSLRGCQASSSAGSAA